MYFVISSTLLLIISFAQTLLATPTAIKTLLTKNILSSLYTAQNFLLLNIPAQNTLNVVTQSNILFMNAMMSTDSDLQRAKEVIESGRAYVKENWIDADMINELRKDVFAREGKGLFKPSGLSNSAFGSTSKQPFNRSDRMISPVSFISTDNSAALDQFGYKIDQLKYDLSVELNRPSMADNSLAHESYFSLSLPESSLKRHLDEKHEELRLKGWSAPSRRSISWLLYLSDDTVKGGELTSYPQKYPLVGTVGSHNQDLQIGWLQISSEVHPVFLDSWRRYRLPNGDSIARSALFIASNENGRNYITNDFDLRHPVSGSPLEVDFNRLLLSHIQKSGGKFYVIEDQTLWAVGGTPIGSCIEEITPKAGSLVLFDSVSLPHEVQVVREGRRIALAGWFHEKQQMFPEWAFA